MALDSDEILPEEDITPDPEFEGFWDFIPPEARVGEEEVVEEEVVEARNLQEEVVEEELPVEEVVEEGPPIEEVYVPEAPDQIATEQIATEPPREAAQAEFDEQDITPDPEFEGFWDFIPPSARVTGPRKIEVSPVKVESSYLTGLSEEEAAERLQEKMPVEPTQAELESLPKEMNTPEYYEKRREVAYAYNRARDNAERIEILREFTQEWMPAAYERAVGKGPIHWGINSIATAATWLDNISGRWMRALIKTSWEDRENEIRKGEMDIRSPPEWWGSFRKHYKESDGDFEDGERTMEAIYKLGRSGVVGPTAAIADFASQLGDGYDSGEDRLAAYDREAKAAMHFGAEVSSNIGYGVAGAFAQVMPGGANWKGYMAARQEAEDAGFVGGHEFMGLVGQIIADPLMFVKMPQIARLGGVANTRKGRGLIDDMLDSEVRADIATRIENGSLSQADEAAEFDRMMNAARNQYGREQLQAANTAFQYELPNWFGPHAPKILRDLKDSRFIHIVDEILNANHVDIPGTRPVRRGLTTPADEALDVPLLTTGGDTRLARLGDEGVDVRATEGLVEDSAEIAAMETYRAEAAWAEVIKESIKRGEVPQGLRVEFKGVDVDTLDNVWTGKIDWVKPEKIGKETAAQAFQRQKMVSVFDNARTKIALSAIRRFPYLEPVRRTTESIYYLEKAQPMAIRSTVADAASRRMEEIGGLLRGETDEVVRAGLQEELAGLYKVRPEASRGKWEVIAPEGQAKHGVMHQSAFKEAEKFELFRQRQSSLSAQQASALEESIRQIAPGSDVHTLSVMLEELGRFDPATSGTIIGAAKLKRMEEIYQRAIDGNFDELPPELRAELEALAAEEGFLDVWRQTVDQAETAYRVNKGPRSESWKTIQANLGNLRELMKRSLGDLFAREAEFDAYRTVEPAVQEARLLRAWRDEFADMLKNKIWASANDFETAIARLEEFRIGQEGGARTPFTHAADQPLSEVFEGYRRKRLLPKGTTEDWTAFREEVRVGLQHAMDDEYADMVMNFADQRAKTWAFWNKLPEEDSVAWFTRTFKGGLIGGPIVRATVDDLPRLGRTVLFSHKETGDVINMFEAAAKIRAKKDAKRAEDIRDRMSAREKRFEEVKKELAAAKSDVRAIRQRMVMADNRGNPSDRFVVPGPGYPSDRHLNVLDEQAAGARRRGREAMAEEDRLLEENVADSRELKALIEKQGEYVAKAEDDILFSESKGVRPVGIAQQNKWLPPLNRLELEEKLVELGDGRSIADWLSKNAEDKSLRAILKRISPYLDDVVVKVVNEGDTVPSSFAYSGASGLSQLNMKKKGPVDIWLRGAALDYSGVNAETITHELLHAATQARMQLARLVSNQGTPLAKAWGELNDLVGTVTSAHKKAFPDTTDAPGPPYLNADELMAWGLTDKKFQNFLRTIKVDGETAFNKFVKLVARLLGIGKGEHNALTKVIRLTDEILAADVKALPEKRMFREGDELFSRAEGGLEPLAYTQFGKDGKAIIGVFENAKGPEAFTAVMEELGHIFRRDLPEPDLKVATEWVKTQFKETDILGRGKKAIYADGRWSEAAEEAFARAFVKWVKHGELPPGIKNQSAMRAVFEKAKEWLVEIYYVIAGRGAARGKKGGPREVGYLSGLGPEARLRPGVEIKITDDLTSVFNRLLDPESVAGRESPLVKEVDDALRAVSGSDGLTKAFAFRQLEAALRELGASAGRTHEEIAAIARDLVSEDRSLIASAMNRLETIKRHATIKDVVPPRLSEIAVPEIKTRNDLNKAVRATLIEDLRLLPEEADALILSDLTRVLGTISDEVKIRPDEAAPIPAAGPPGFKEPPTEVVADPSSLLKENPDWLERGADESPISWKTRMSEVGPEDLEAAFTPAEIAEIRETLDKSWTDEQLNAMAGDETAIQGFVSDSMRASGVGKEDADSVVGHYWENIKEAAGEAEFGAESAFDEWSDAVSEAFKLYEEWIESGFIENPRRMPVSEIANSPHLRQVLDDIQVDWKVGLTEKQISETKAAAELGEYPLNTDDISTPKEFRPWAIHELRAAGVPEAEAKKLVSGKGNELDEIKRDITNDNDWASERADYDNKQQWFLQFEDEILERLEDAYIQGFVSKEGVEPKLLPVEDLRAAVEAPPAAAVPGAPVMGVEIPPTTDLASEFKTVWPDHKTDHEWLSVDKIARKIFGYADSPFMGDHRGYRKMDIDVPDWVPDDMREAAKEWVDSVPFRDAGGTVRSGGNIKYRKRAWGKLVTRVRARLDREFVDGYLDRSEAASGRSFEYSRNMGQRAWAVEPDGRVVRVHLKSGSVEGHSPKGLSKLLKKGGLPTVQDLRAAVEAPKPTRKIIEPPKKVNPYQENYREIITKLSGEYVKKHPSLAKRGARVADVEKMDASRARAIINDFDEAWSGADGGSGVRSKVMDYVYRGMARNVPDDLSEMRQAAESLLNEAYVGSRQQVRNIMRAINKVIVTGSDREAVRKGIELFESEIAKAKDIVLRQRSSASIEEAAAISAQKSTVSDSTLARGRAAVSWLDGQIRDRDTFVHKEMARARKDAKRVRRFVDGEEEVTELGRAVADAETDLRGIGPEEGGEDAIRAAIEKLSDPEVEVRGETGTLGEYPDVGPIARLKTTLSEAARKPPEGEIKRSEWTVATEVTEALDDMLAAKPKTKQAIMDAAREMGYDFRTPAEAWGLILTAKKWSRSYGDELTLRKKMALEAYRNDELMKIHDGMSQSMRGKLNRLIRNPKLYGVSKDAPPRIKALAKDIGMVGTDELFITLRGRKRKSVGEQFTDKEIEQALEIAKLVNDAMDQRLDELQAAGILTYKDPQLVAQANQLREDLQMIRHLGAEAAPQRDQILGQIADIEATYNRKWSKEEFLNRTNLAAYMPHLRKSMSRGKTTAMSRGGMPSFKQASFEKWRTQASYIDDLNEQRRNILATENLYHNAANMEGPAWGPGGPLEGMTPESVVDAANRGQLEELMTVDEWDSAVAWSRENLSTGNLYEFFEPDLHLLMDRYMRESSRSIADAVYLKDMADMFPVGEEVARLVAGSPVAIAEIRARALGYSRLSKFDTISATTGITLPPQLRKHEEFILNMLQTTNSAKIADILDGWGINVTATQIDAFKLPDKYLPTPVVEYQRWMNKPDWAQGKWWMGWLDGFHALAKGMATVSSIAHVGMNFSGNEVSIAQKLGTGIFNPANHLDAISIFTKLEPEDMAKFKKNMGVRHEDSVVTIGKYSHTVGEWRKLFDEAGISESPQSKMFLEEMGATTGGKPMPQMVGAAAGFLTGGAAGFAAAGPIGAAAGAFLGQYPGALLGELAHYGFGSKVLRDMPGSALRKSPAAMKEGWNRVWFDEMKNFQEAIDVSTQKGAKKAVQYFGERSVGMTAGASIGSVFGPPGAIAGAIAGMALPSYMRMMTGLNQAVETQARMTLAVGELRAGKSIQEAAESVDDALRNYSHLTPVEKHVLRRVFFFYTWDAGNMRFQMRQLAKSPRQAAVFGHFMNGIYKGQFNEEEIQAMPENLRWKPIIRTGPAMVWSINGLPQAAFLEMLGRWSDGKPAGLLTRARPDALLLFEMFSDKRSVYYGKGWDELTNVRMLKNASPFLKMFAGFPANPGKRKIYDKDGKHVGWKEDYRAAHPERFYMMSKVPGWRILMEQLKLQTDTFTSRAIDYGDPNAVATPVQKALSFLGGSRPYSIDFEAQMDYYNWRFLEAIQRQIQNQDKSFWVSIKRAVTRMPPGDGQLRIPGGGIVTPTTTIEPDVIEPTVAQ